MNYLKHKKTHIIGLLLAFLLLFGCSAVHENESTVQASENASFTSIALPSEDTVSIGTPVPANDTVSILQPTPEPTAEPTTAPTDTPTPLTTDTPEPNPYLGTWVIEDMPFMMDIRSDGTCSIISGEQEIVCSYTYDSADLYVSITPEQTVAFRYYYKVNKLMSDNYVLVRSEIETPVAAARIPISFENDNDAVSVYVRGAVVDVKVKDDRLVQQYCFTNQGLSPLETSRDWFDVLDSGEPSSHFRVYKFDGSYTLWLRNAEGELLSPIDVTVVSGFRYPIQAEGLDPVRHSLKTVLEENRTSVKNLNTAISEDVVAAGIYTREGVVTAGVSLISHMSEMGYSIVYQGKGSYQAQDDWGVNPQWGSKLDEPTTDGNGTYYYCGMQCVASIVWAYKQAGMNLFSTLRSEIGRLGELTKSGDNKIDYDRAETGDIVRAAGHYLMVIDRLDQNGDGADDAYLTYEMWAPHLTMLVLTFRQVRGRVFYSMDAFFEDTGHNAKKAVYWKNTFRIPQEAFPQYLKDAAQRESDDQAFSEFLKQFGL